MGFNLVELMLVLGLATILLGIGIPSLTSTMEKGELQSEARRLAHIFNQARSEAVTNQRGVGVGVEPLAGGWSSGWRIYFDNNGNQIFDAPDDVIKQFEATRGSLSIAANTSASGRVVFQRNGRLEPAEHAGNAVTIAICDANNSDKFDGSQITINTVGRVSVAPIPAAQKTSDCTP